MGYTRQELDQILDSDKSFSDYVTQHDNALDACTIELMQSAYNMDGGAMSDEDLLKYYADILATRSHVMNCHA